MGRIVSWEFHSFEKRMDCYEGYMYDTMMHNHDFHDKRSRDPSGEHNPFAPALFNTELQTHSTPGMHLLLT